LSTKQELGGYQDLQVQIHLDHGSELRNSDSKAQSFKLTHERAEDGTNYNSIRLVAETQSHVGLTWNKVYSVANQ